MASKEKILATAQKFLQKNNLNRAIKEYLKVIEIDPNDVRSRQKLAELYSRTSNIEEALTHYAAVAAYYSENTFYLKAIAVYKQMQKLAPENANYTLRLAQLNEQQGLIGNALAEYRLLLSSYEKTGEDEQAIEILNKMQALDPANINIGMRIAEFYARIGDDARAQEEFDKVEQRLIKLANYQPLRKFYENFMSLWPDNIAVQIGFGRAMVEFGEPLGGVEFLTKLQRQHPKNPDVLYALSCGFHACSDYSHEFECLDRLIQWVPDSLEYRLALFNAALETIEPERVFTYLEDGKQLFQDAERVAELKVFYEKLRDLLPENRDLISSLHDIYEQLGEGEKLFDVMSSDFAVEGNDYSETIVVDDDGVSDPGAFDEINFESSVPESETSDETSFDDITFDLTSDVTTEEGVDEFDFNVTSTESAPVVDIQTDLEEADFYLQQGLLDEAQLVCERLSAASPDNEKVAALKQQIIDQRQKNGGSSGADKLADFEISVPESASEDEVVLDLDVGELDASLAGTSAADDFDFADNDVDIESSLSGLGEEKSVQTQGQNLADSQRGVVTVINDEDTESAYNLGIAYKEMGLVEDAIAEFDKAMVSPSRKIDSILLKSSCYMEQQKFDMAEEVLTLGLSDSGLSKKEQVLLFYETGLLYEAWDRYADALSSYQVVADNDPSFRDVATKVVELKDMVDGENGVAPYENRVSYL